jgi:hypothetical protein
MAEKQEHSPSPGLLTTEQLESILRTLVSEIRKPPFDPVKNAQKEREQKTKIEALATYWSNKFRKRDNCKHEREDGTCLIAWATQSDNVERGACPICDWVFKPEDGELYQEMRRKNRGRKENVRYVA